MTRQNNVSQLVLNTVMSEIWNSVFKEIVSNQNDWNGEINF